MGNGRRSLGARADAVAKRPKPEYLEPLSLTGRRRLARRGKSREAAGIMASLRFYFDFISPYAYLGWKAIHAVAERHDRTVEPVPILFAGLLSHFGHKGPAEIPPKRTYIFKHVLRLAAEAQLPLSPPPAHPFRPLLGLRICGLPQLSDDERRRAIDALYDATWGDGPGIEDPTVVAGLLDAVGLDGGALCEAATQPAAKQRLIEATQAAVADGVFGVPAVRVDEELFWGYDAFGHVEAFLEGKDPISQDDLQKWSDLPASAHRK